MDRSATFIELSAVLTGVEAVRLSGSDLVATYIAELECVLPPDMLGDLLARFAALPRGFAFEAALDADLLDDPRLGPVARNIILLWYCGAWTRLPTAWRESFGKQVPDPNGDPDRHRVISGAAYAAGLQWIAAGGHAPGANHTGFASWAMLPREWELI